MTLRAVCCSLNSHSPCASDLTGWWWWGPPSIFGWNIWALVCRPSVSALSSGVFVRRFFRLSVLADCRVGPPGLYSSVSPVYRPSATRDKHSGLQLCPALHPHLPGGQTSFWCFLNCSHINTLLPESSYGLCIQSLYYIHFWL